MPEPEISEAPDGVEDALGGDEGLQRAGRVVARELGSSAAETFVRVWRRQDAAEARRRPDEGLRERKKRQTRQRISDVATTLFVARGFDSVRVAEIADTVGVSEKTIYNYFPTKESLVFDETDAQLDALATALRERPSGVSPSQALVEALRRDVDAFDETILDKELDALSAFGKMVRETPALRAAWEEHRHRLLDSVVAILAEELGVDPREPEPAIAGQALVGLIDLFYTAQLRDVAEGRGLASPDEIMPRLERAARLLDEGLWGPWNAVSSTD